MELKILLAIEAVTALVFIGLALPLMHNKVPPNHWYGVRTRKTLSDETVWYKANAYFGRDFLFASLFVLATCVVLFIAGDPIAGEEGMITVTVALVIPYIAVTVKTLFYIHRL